MTTLGRSYLVPLTPLLSSFLVVCSTDAGMAWRAWRLQEGHVCQAELPDKELGHRRTAATGCTDAGRRAAVVFRQQVQAAAGIRITLDQQLIWRLHL